MERSAEVTELQPGIFQIRGLNGSSHSYVIKGNYKNVMIDSGSDQNFPVLERGLFRIGLNVRDIDLVINSHEHCDHIGANRYFHESTMIAAYRGGGVQNDLRRLLRHDVQGKRPQRNPNAGALVARKYDPHRSWQ